MGPARPRRRVVLVGGGHSHVIALRKHLMDPLPDVELTVIVDELVAVYSGMVPGVVAGQYARHEVEIDGLPLARRAGARVVHAKATRVDHASKRVEVEGRPPVPYDLCSIDIGSTVAGADLPGVREHAVPTRPIARLVERVEALELPAGDAPFPVVVVGGGAGGVELAFCIRERLLARGVPGVQVTLVHSGDRLLKGRTARLAERTLAAFAARGIAVRRDARVAELTADEVVLEGGERLPARLVLWVAGATAHPLARDSGLPVEHRGFIRTRATLEVEGIDDLFAVGDCAVPASWPEIPKAGVYAVRQGPALVDNLRRKLMGRAPRDYRPQRDFLLLLNCGDGTALGEKWGLTFGGGWVFRLKDHIDRTFMGHYQVLTPEGAPEATFESGLAPMPEMEMVCGGCAAKVGETPLKQALARLPAVVGADDVTLGLKEVDDAVAVARPDGTWLVSNLDAFTAFTDDPWLVGRVAANNAMSDLLAKGVDPRWAMAIVNVPDDAIDEAETLFQLLAGAREALDAQGCTLLGGHTTKGPQLVMGFWVQGVAERPEGVWANHRLRMGDALVLSRGVGTGVLFHADMAGRARGPWIHAAVQGMLRGNGPASQAARAFDVSAATDVTGFGLAGHLGELLRAGSATTTLTLADVPALPGARALMAAGLRSTFHEQNRDVAKALKVSRTAAHDSALELLFDPQTGGGLLFAVLPEQADALVAALREVGEDQACVLGHVEPPREDLALFEVR